jgi:hypothetical protein
LRSARREENETTSGRITITSNSSTISLYVRGLVILGPFRNGRPSEVESLVESDPGPLNSL